MGLSFGIGLYIGVLVLMVLMSVLWLMVRCRVFCMWMLLSGVFLLLNVSVVLLVVWLVVSVKLLEFFSCGVRLGFIVVRMLMLLVRVVLILVVKFGMYWNLICVMLVFLF